MEMADGYFENVKAENRQAKENFPRSQMLKKSVCMISSLILAAPMLCCIHVNLKQHHGMPIACYDLILRLWLWFCTSKVLILCCNIMIVAVVTRSELLKISWGNDDTLYAEFVRNESAAGTNYEAPETEDNSDINAEEQIKCICWENGNSIPEPRPRSTITVGESTDGHTEDQSTDVYSSSLVFVEAPAAQEDANEDQMVIDDELNKRFEDFIAKIKYQIRKGV